MGLLSDAPAILQQEGDTKLRLLQRCGASSAFISLGNKKQCESLTVIVINKLNSEQSPRHLTHTHTRQDS